MQIPALHIACYKHSKLPEEKYNTLLLIFIFIYALIYKHELQMHLKEDKWGPTHITAQFIIKPIKLFSNYFQDTLLTFN